MYSTRNEDVCDFVQQKFQNAPILSTQEQLELIKKYRRARKPERKEALRMKLISTLWRYAVKEASRFEHIIDIHTARQAAYIGLIETLDKYRLNSGVAVTTYMYWWVRFEIIRTIHKVKYQVRIPEYLYNKLKKSIEKSGSKVSYMTASEMAAMIFGDNPTIEQMRMIEVFTQTSVPLEQLKKQSGGSSKARTQYVDKGYVDMEIDHDIRKAIFDSGVLDKREKDILCMYYGLDGIEKCGLKEIGKKYKVTRERIRQILDACYRKIAPYLVDYKEEFKDM